MSQLAQALIALDGQIGLVAQDGSFLGLIYSDPNHPNSIINPNTYANRFGETIHNQFSEYGGQYGLYSPYNSFCLNPPILFDINEQCLAVVTRNKYVNTNGLDIIDIDFILEILYQLSERHRPNLSHQLSDAYAEAARNQAQASATLMANILGQQPKW
jgi:hypothetical protein